MIRKEKLRAHTGNVPSRLNVCHVKSCHHVMSCHDAKNDKHVIFHQIGAMQLLCKISTEGDVYCIIWFTYDLVDRSQRVL